MQSRVPVRPRHRCRVPAGFGGIAAGGLADQHQPGGASRLGCKLQPPPGGQRQRLLRLGDHQSHRPRAQRLLDRPEQVGLVRRADHQQPFAHAIGQAAQHRQVRRMGGEHPDQRARMARRLEQREGTPARPLGLVHPCRGEGGKCGRGGARREGRRIGCGQRGGRGQERGRGHGSGQGSGCGCRRGHGSGCAPGRGFRRGQGGGRSAGRGQGFGCARGRNPGFGRGHGSGCARGAGRRAGCGRRQGPGRRAGRSSAPGRMAGSGVWSGLRHGVGRARGCGQARGQAGSLRPHPRAPLRRQSAASRPAADAGAPAPRRPGRSASAASPRDRSG